MPHTPTSHASPTTTTKGGAPSKSRRILVDLCAPTKAFLCFVRRLKFPAPETDNERLLWNCMLSMFITPSIHYPTSPAIERLLNDVILRLFQVIRDDRIKQITLVDFANYQATSLDTRLTPVRIFSWYIIFCVMRTHLFCTIKGAIWIFALRCIRLIVEGSTSKHKTTSGTPQISPRRHLLKKCVRSALPILRSHLCQFSENLDGSIWNCVITIIDFAMDSRVELALKPQLVSTPRTPCIIT